MYKSNIQRLVATMAKLSLVIIKGIEYKGIMKSGSFCSLRNILYVGHRHTVYSAVYYQTQFIQCVI